MVRDVCDYLYEVTNQFLWIKCIDEINMGLSLTLKFVQIPLNNWIKLNFFSTSSKFFFLKKNWFCWKQKEKVVVELFFSFVESGFIYLFFVDKRAKFDQGEDPLDPESGNHQGFNPFQEFHHFHSGTPFTFKFHFN